MICPRCIARGAARSGVLQRRAITSTSRRCFVASSSTRSEQTPITANTATTSAPQRDPPAATSTSAAQPFSTPETYGPGIEGTPTQPKKTPRPKSSVPAGTTLKGLNYFKGKQDPVALEDEEYPDWLWTVLDEKKSADAGLNIENDPRIYSKSANARRKANKQLRKALASIPADVVKKIPVYEQTVDLPRSEGEAGAARHDLTRAMREKRRKGIKEANFLQTMR